MTLTTDLLLEEAELDQLEAELAEARRLLEALEKRRRRPIYAVSGPEHAAIVEARLEAVLEVREEIRERERRISWLRWCHDH